MSVAFSIDKWSPHAPSVLCVWVLVAPRELNNFEKIFSRKFCSVFFLLVFFSFAWSCFQLSREQGSR